jgi:hypothetical protein
LFDDISFLFHDNTIINIIWDISIHHCHDYWIVAEFLQACNSHDSRNIRVKDCGAITFLTFLSGDNSFHPFKASRFRHGSRYLFDDGSCSIVTCYYFTAILAVKDPLIACALTGIVKATMLNSNWSTIYSCFLEKIRPAKKALCYA